MIGVFFKKTVSLLKAILKFFSLTGNGDISSEENNLQSSVDSFNIDELLARFDHSVSKAALNKWLNNFKDIHKPDALRLLDNLEFVSQADLFYYANELVEEVLEAVAKEVPIYFIPIAKYGKSATLLSFYIQKSNAFKEAQANSQVFFLATPQEVALRVYEADSVLVFFDDFLGSGGSFIETYRPFCGFAPGGIKHLRTMVAALFYMPLAKQNISAAYSDVEIRGLLHYPVFEIPPQLWRDKEETDNLKFISHSYAADAKLWYNKHLLGYNSSQALIAFSYMPPNNTLPIIWASRNEWFPLMPRAQEVKLSEREQNKIELAYAAARKILSVPTNNPLTSNKNKDNYIIVSILEMIDKGITHAAIQVRLAMRGKLYDSFIKKAYEAGLIDDYHMLTPLGKSELADIHAEIESYRKKGAKNVRFVLGDYAPKKIS